MKKGTGIILEENEGFEGKTYRSSLYDELFNQLDPIRSFYKLVDEFLYETSPEMQNICLILKPLLNQLEMNLQKIEEVITRSLGAIGIEGVCHGEYVTFEGKDFFYGDYIRAFVDRKEEAVPAPEARPKALSGDTPGA